MNMNENDGISENVKKCCANLINGLGNIRLDYVRAVGRYFDLELIYHMGRYTIMIGNNEIMMYGIYPELEGDGYCLVEDYGDVEMILLIAKLANEVLEKLKELRDKTVQEIEAIDASSKAVLGYFSYEG